MHERTPCFTWVPEMPAPFESAWMIFTKLMVLNYQKPHMIWDVITNAPSSNKGDKKLLLYDSDWIDFERFSKALGVPSNRLRAGFLDQMDFSTRPFDIESGIKLCPVCLTKGYHCTFFSLPLINVCPWHGCELMSACNVCARTVEYKGLKREEKQVDRDRLDVRVIYRSECGHVIFSPEAELNLQKLTWAEQLGIHEDCILFLKWCRQILESSHPYTGIARQLLVGSGFSNREMCLSAAIEIAGPCPWPLNGASRRISFCEFYKNTDRHSYQSFADQQKNYYVNFKALRRHVFGRYLKKHRACISYLTKLKNYGAQYLIASTICPLALAFISWRMHIERVSFPSQLKRKRNSKRWVQTRFTLPHENSKWFDNSKSLLLMWFIEFFTTLYRINSSLDNESFDIEQWNFDYWPIHHLENTAHTFVTSGEFVSEEDTEFDLDTVNGRWLVVYPKVEDLIKEGLCKCEMKLDRKILTAEMYMVGSLSLLNYRPRRDVQFRVLNLSKERYNYKKSHAYYEQFRLFRV